MDATPPHLPNPNSDGTFNPIVEQLKAVHPTNAYHGIPVAEKAADLGSIDINPATGLPNNPLPAKVVSAAFIDFTTGSLSSFNFMTDMWVKGCGTGTEGIECRRLVLQFAIQTMRANPKIKQRLNWESGLAPGKQMPPKGSAQGKLLRNGERSQDRFKMLLGISNPG